MIKLIKNLVHLYGKPEVVTGGPMDYLLKRWVLLLIFRNKIQWKIKLWIIIEGDKIIKTDINYCDGE